MAASFEQHRIGQLSAWLDELTSLLPDHSAKAVAQSLTWWQQAVAVALTGHKQSRKNQASQPAPRQQPTATLTPRRRRTATRLAGPPSMESLTATVARQGALWRGVLDGDKLCTDLLTPPQYLRAGERLARHYARLVRQTLRSMPWLLVFLLLLLAAAVLVLAVIPGSAVARTATAIAAVAGTFSAIWKLIRTRVAPIAAQLERPSADGLLSEVLCQPDCCLPRLPEQWQHAEAPACWRRSRAGIGVAHEQSRDLVRWPGSARRALRVRAVGAGADGRRLVGAGDRGTWPGCPEHEREP